MKLITTSLVAMALLLIPACENFTVGGGIQIDPATGKPITTITVVPKVVVVTSDKGK